MMLFEFEESADLERVLLHEPWSYDKSLVAFRRIEEEDEPETIAFDRATFWIQIHNLPVLALKKEIALAIGKSAGTVVRASEIDEEVGGGRMMRVRVQVDISKPLCWGRKLGMANGGERWVSFRYERLPNFCYWCGLLTHGEKDCKFWLKNQETLSREDRGYGTWLRAEMDRPFRKMEVTVPGRARPPPTSDGATTEPKKAAPPPTTAEAPQRNDESGDMECEDFPEFPKQGELFSASQHTTFEEHLRIIGMEIGFGPAHPTDLQVFAGPPTFQAHVNNELTPCMIPKDPLRPTNAVSNAQPLRELTNLSPLSNLPRKHGTETWKKKAQAQGSNSGQAPLITLEKRSWDENQDPCGDDDRLGKIARTLQQEFILVAAVSQPRREQ
jgi:hypothetical protein